jgi:recombinational DNA repair protein RecT
MSNLAIIKKDLFSDGMIKLFKDNLPFEGEAMAVKMAKRYSQMAYTAVCNSPKLQECTPGSIAKAACIAASLNLDIDPRGLAYLVPFKKQAV